MKKQFLVGLTITLAMTMTLPAFGGVCLETKYRKPENEMEYQIGGIRMTMEVIWQTVGIGLMEIRMGGLKVTDLTRMAGCMQQLQ